MRSVRAGWLKNDVVRAAARAQEFAAKAPPCRSRPQEEWCDRYGPGGFMGHTCNVPRGMQQPIVVNDLPMPPSVNALFANVSRRKDDVVAAALSHVGLAPKKKMRGRKITPRYAAWLQLAGYKLNLAKQRPIVGRVTVLLELDDTAVRPADSDNFSKGPLDLLVKHGLIEDDNYNVVRETTQRWRSGGGLSITVTPCTN